MIHPHLETWAHVQLGKIGQVIVGEKGKKSDGGDESAWIASHVEVFLRGKPREWDRALCDWITKGRWEKIPRKHPSEPIRDALKRFGMPYLWRFRESCIHKRIVREIDFQYRVWSLSNELPPMPQVAPAEDDPIPDADFQLEIRARQREGLRLLRETQEKERIG